MPEPPGPRCSAALIRGDSLTADESEWAMNEIMEGAATPSQIAGFGVALRMKGTSVAEMTGLARSMLAHATPVHLPGRLTDLVGTGGDGARTVNVSTMGTIVAAAAGARMIKHGNRAASSSCGAADVLEALGVAIDLPPAATAELAAEVGVAFLFAPLYHPALRYAGPTRSELGVPTVFNFLGPVANPARPWAQAVGVSDPRMGEIIAGVLAGRGCSALVFRGDDGLDELTTTARPRCGSCTTARWRRRSSTPPRSGCRGRPSPTCAAATPSTTRRWSARCWPASAGRSATSCC